MIFFLFGKGRHQFTMEYLECSFISERRSCQTALPIRSHSYHSSSAVFSYSIHTKWMKLFPSPCSGGPCPVLNGRLDEVVCRANTPAALKMIRNRRSCFQLVARRDSPFPPLRLSNISSSGCAGRTAGAVRYRWDISDQHTALLPARTGRHRC